MLLGESEIVISGISGRFPESANLNEFWENLINGVDMVTDIRARWDVETFDMPRRMGQLKGLEKFDANFMGVHGKQAENMDPRLRIGLELTHEAVIDAGINPVTIRGSRTGVYVGSSGEETLQELETRSADPSGYCATGSMANMLSNRISFAYDLKGPSMTIDTACSSSLVALHQALSAIRTGICDAAIVAGLHLCLDPKRTLMFTNLGINSTDGKCRSFDVAADGYVRSEAAVVLHITKSEFARRSYATIVHGKTNVDGYKVEGITFPSGAMQEQLLREVYAEAGVDPKDVDYVEAHGTGTRAGDPEEGNAIARVFCEGRDVDNPLLIGSVKSNMGHPEVASGLCQIAKVILAHQHGVIPGNLHYTTPNPGIPALAEGRIKVVEKNIDFSGSLVGVNSFGFGGSNVHILLKLATRKDPPSWEPEIPVIVPFSGRTVEVESSLEELLESRDSQLVALLQEISETDIPGHHFRSYAIVQEDDTRIKSEEIVGGEKRPIWFVFSGMGTQHPGMVGDMMKFPIFRESVEKSIEALKTEGFDFAHVLYSNDESELNSGFTSAVAVTVVQVALVYLLNSLGVSPDGIFGHSLGEVATAYADRCLTADQTVLVSLARGRSFDKFKFSGAMASVGLTWEEAGRRCPENVYAACHNTLDNVTISGPVDLVNAFAEELHNEGVFVRKVQSSGFAFHSRYMKSSEVHMRKSLIEIIPNPKKRTARWISTSVPEEKKGSDLEKYCSVDYFINNALAPVRFYEALLCIPPNAVVLEVAPHNLMQSIHKRTLPDSVSCIGVMNRKSSSNCTFFLESMGQLYLKGCNPNFRVLYEKVKFPVTSATPMISPVIRWDHSDDWFVPSHQNKMSKSGGDRIQVSLENTDESFYSGHAIDGRIIFPAAGYMWLVWTTFAKQHGKKCEQQPIIFEDLRFERSTMLPVSGAVEFFVNIFPDNGDFEVYEKDSAVCRGRIRELLKSEDSMFPESDKRISRGQGISLNAEDFYKELRLRGYEYTGVFRGVEKADLRGEWAELRWQNNWIGFLDTFLQIAILQNQQRGLYLPIRLQEAIIDPVKFLSFRGYSSLIPVKTLKHVSTVKAPGVELRGLKVSVAPRRPTTAPTMLQKQLFVPYNNSLGLSKPNCFEYFQELVMDNTSGRNFVFVEFQNSLENCVHKYLIPHFPPKFENPSLFVISDDASTKLEQAGVTLISLKEITRVKKANLVFVPQESIQLAEDIVAENGFMLVQGRVPPSNLPEYEVVAQNLENNLQLYRRRPKSLHGDNKSMVKIRNDSFEWVEELQGLISETSSKVFIYSAGSQGPGAIGFVRCLLREGYDNIRCFCIKDDSYNPDFTSPDAQLESQISLDLVFNVHESGTWGSYCNCSMSAEALNEPRIVADSFVNALHPGDLTTVRWIESPLATEQVNRTNLCKVHYSALNFRDVMLATGKLSRDALPGDLAFQECVLGMEFAGLLNEKPVFGMQNAKCLATSVKIDENGFLWEVPDKWTLAEAATVPVAYATAYYALVVRGRMRKGETVLIHAGSGGVGQASIAIALSLQCKVITTVSSEEKRQFLKDRFPELSDECFTDSRNASVFENHVMGITNGRGVDIVLNSLAQEKLKASVRCLAKYGRFLEIGKFDLFNNSALGMEIFLRSVNFQGILLDDIIQSASDEKEEVADLIRNGIESGVVKPLPVSLFSCNQLEDAFRFMATGKHMGKVVVSICVESPLEILAFPRTYFHIHKSYVLIGGLGGMGLEIADWMVSRGARKLVFVSRSGVTTGYQAYRVQVLRHQGVAVIVDNSDVSTQAGAQGVLKLAAGLGPVGGIFNFAVALKDAIFPNQTAEYFEIVSKAKIKATVELDKASRNLETKLDYFVVFSSIASSKGNAGQTSYAFANEFMERLCEERCEAGLHGLAIQWGAIGDVGVLHNLMGGKDVTVAGSVPQKMASCLEMLDLFLQQSHPVVSSFVPMVTDVSNEKVSKTLVDLVAHVLAIKHIAKINKKLTLVELGMDSLMATEIKILLEKEKNFSVPVAAVGELTFSQLQEMESNQLNPDDELDAAKDLTIANRASDG